MELWAFVFVGVLLQGSLVLGKNELDGLPSKSPVGAGADNGSGYYRLPQTVVPNTYSLQLIPSLVEGNFTFRGRVEISLNVLEETDRITLHSKGLNVKEDYLYNDGNSSAGLIIENVTDYADREFHVLYLKDALVKGDNYTLKMEFEGELKEDLDGFYRSSYKDTNGKTEWMAVTQFESSSARKAFPCFDEPHLKAKFTVSIGRPKDMNTLSNMRLNKNATLSEPLPDGYEWDIYEETPKMSTYLVAFAVSKFKSNPEDSERIFHVWSRGNAIQQTNYSAEVGPKILEVMKNMTTIEFALPKMDLIAVPDFQAGAMENWGLVTFRETFLLYDGETSTPYDEQQVISVVAHELSHQWFGDLVSPEWWTYTWLNEGFATYWMYAVTDVIEPNWRMMEQFVIESVQKAFNSDAMDSTRQMTFNITSPADMSNEFGDIAYQKAASVIRMMEHFLTKDVFLQGLAKYLSENEYSTGNEDLLFSALNTVTGDSGFLPPNVTVSSVMKTWTQQVGYPVINVMRMNSGNTTFITQERFVLENVTNGVDMQWCIPLTYTTQSSPNFDKTTPAAWTCSENISLSMGNLATKDDWIIFNIQATGYYRVNYDKRNWALLINYLKGENFTKIHPVNRGQLVDDSLNLARGGYLNYATALDLADYLAQETDFIPWYSSYRALDFLDTLLAQATVYPNFGEFMRYVLKTQYEKLHFKESSSDDHVTHLSRAQLLPRACKYDYGDCVKTATSLFDNWVQTKVNTIPVNFRSTAYCFGVSKGGKKEWNFLWDAYSNTTNAAELSRIMQALACSKDKNILEGYLNKTVDDANEIRLQDREHVFMYVYSRTEGLDVALDFLISRINDIREKCGNDTATGVILGISSRISSTKQADKMKTFLSKNKESVGATASDSEKALKLIQDNMSWLEKYGPTVEYWLNHNHPASSAIHLTARAALVLAATFVVAIFNARNS